MRIYLKSQKIYLFFCLNTVCGGHFHKNVVLRIYKDENSFEAVLAGSPSAGIVFLLSAAMYGWQHCHLHLRRWNTGMHKLIILI